MTPDEIIGSYNMPLFKRHLEIAIKDNDGVYPSKKLEKEFSKPELAFIARKHDELHQAGFVVDRIDERGDIRWLHMTESASWDAFKSGEFAGVAPLSELKRMPEERLMQIGRSIYRKMIAEMQVDRN